MKVLFLSGASKTGKTTSFNELYNIMLADTVNFTCLTPKIDMASYSTCGHHPSKMKSDFYSKFMDLKKHKSIVLFSMGDYYYDILYALRNNSTCDIFVCALNDNIKAKGLFIKNVDSIYHPKYISHSRSISTHTQASNLYSEINSAI